MTKQRFIIVPLAFIQSKDVAKVIAQAEWRQRHPIEDWLKRFFHALAQAEYAPEMIQVNYASSEESLSRSL